VKRFIYAFSLSVFFVGILMIFDMVIMLGIGEIIFSFGFFSLLMIFSYVIAPCISRYIKFDRRDGEI
jgi:hypothetical protein